jgi:hypothetical protein
MLDRTVRTKLKDSYFDERSKKITCTLEEFEIVLAETDWYWHKIEDEDLASQKKIIYENMMSLFEALNAKYYTDKKMLMKIKQLHNKYAPPRYDIP